MADTEKPREPAKLRPVSLHPLSFEEAVKALAATPTVTEKKPKRQAAGRRKQPNRKKVN